MRQKKIQGLYDHSDTYYLVLARVFLRETQETKRRHISDGQKRRWDPKPNPSHLPSLGIPSFNHIGKLTEVVPVKVGSTLKKAIPKPQSTWIRQVITKQLEREAEETG